MKKKCKKCGIEKSKEHYYVYRNGYAFSICKPCARERAYSYLKKPKDIYYMVDKKCNHKLISAERLRQVIEYDKDTGIFTWKYQKRYLKEDSIGKPSGYVNNSNFRYYIAVDGRRYSATHLAWLYVYGEYPKYRIHTINGNNLDLRIANLYQNLKRPLKERSEYDRKFSTHDFVMMIKNHEKNNQEYRQEYKPNDFFKMIRK